MECEVHEASMMQAAQLLGVSASTLRRWLGSGKLDDRRAAHGRGTLWRVLLSPELPAAAEALHALLARQSLARLHALELSFAETPTLLDLLRARLDAHDAQDALAFTPQAVAGPRGARG